MVNLSRIFLLIKQLLMSFILFDFEELKLDWYILKVNVLYPAELLEWRREGRESELLESFDTYAGQYD